MSPFEKSLARLHRGRILGRIVVLVLGLAFAIGLGLLIHGLADYFLALTPGTRRLVNIALILLASAIGVFLIFRILRTSPSATAGLADDALADPRRRSLAASHLAAKPGETGMEEFHRQRALAEAGEELSRLPAKVRFPLKSLGITAGIVLLLAGGIALLKSKEPEKFEVVAERILTPGSGRAPYSPLIFQVTPDDPRALYGGEAVVEVDISGGEIPGSVVCLVRDPNSGRIEETATFQKEPGVYVRKFDNAQAPVEFAFATGRARSDWHRLDVLFQPRISAATVTIKPPAYTGRSAETFPLDSGEIKAPEGSEIRLTLESNRPLSGGSLSLSTLDQKSEQSLDTVEAERTDEKKVAFTFTAHRSMKVSALVQDIRTTPAEKPLQLTLLTVPDQAPLVTLSEPQPMVLATPRTRLPLAGDIDDDYGLAKVSLTRALVGYRDRSRLLADSLVKKEFTFNDRLDLGKLGVEPGQMLEFYLEASDRNPSLLGIGVSNVVKVQIISEDDYAARLRSQFDLKNFTARYQALASAVKDSRKALAELQEALKGGNTEELAKAKKAAEDAHQKSAEMTQKIAEDFKAFDLEGRLQETARDIQKKLETNKSELQAVTGQETQAELGEQITKMQDRLGGAEQSANDMVQDAQLAAQIGGILKHAADYRRIIKSQESIVTRLDEVIKGLRRGETGMAQRLPGLAQVQKRNREALQKLLKDLREEAEDLPVEVETMYQDIQKFLEAVEKLDIPSPMDGASAEALAGRSPDALNQAALALRLLNEAIDQPDNGF